MSFNAVIPCSVLRFLMASPIPNCSVPTAWDPPRSSMQAKDCGCRTYQPARPSRARPPFQTSQPLQIRRLRLPRHQRRLLHQHLPQLQHLLLRPLLHRQQHRRPSDHEIHPLHLIYCGRNALWMCKLCASGSKCAAIPAFCPGDGRSRCFGDADSLSTHAGNSKRDIAHLDTARY